MKIIKINHIRCGELEKSVYCFAPDEMTTEEIEGLVTDAQAEYMTKLKELDAAGAKPEWLTIDQLAHQDDLTMKEAKALIELNKIEYKEFQRRTSAMLGSFTKYLEDRGIRNISYADNLEVDVDWQHNHGKKLSY